MLNHPPTTVCVLTPPGRGAVAVIAVEGPKAVELVEAYFRPQRQTGLAGRAINAIIYGKWGDDPAEDVIICRREKDRVEVHCHGGTAAMRRIIDELSTAGAVETTWQDWITRGESTAIQAAAREALAGATTARTAAILLDQYRGALETAFQQIVALLDAPDAMIRAADLIEQLLKRAPVGLHLTQPWRVVIAGPPNVGKSSLINALLGFARAIVFDQPGTTRDVVSAQTALDGWPVELVDTAGWRISDDPLEAAGVERAQAEAAAADCLLLVFDASQPWSAENQRLVDHWPAAMVIHNKCDLAKPPSAAAVGWPVSAVSGEGLDELVSNVVARLVTDDPQPGTAVPFTVQQRDRLQAAAKLTRTGNIESARAELLALLV